MKLKGSLFAIVLLYITQFTFSQKNKTDANVVGHVTSNGEHLAFATVGVKGTTIGTMTDETGHFQLIHMPIGEYTVVISVVGYQPQERQVFLEAKKTIEIKVDLQEDVLNLEEVVVSADRAEQKRTEAAVIVNTMSPKLFDNTQSVTLGEGLSFSPGLRLENNCQNCGFSQVRMNGMEGPYSQILINSRPIFSGLAGVYGLELIPANMIEKVEVVRGGGSALFGSNAIAGTINVIMKEPNHNSYEAGVNYSSMGVGLDGSGDAASDFTVNFNASVVSDDHKSGVSVYGLKRKRDMFDANDDSYSEISQLENLTFGAKAFHRFGYRDKLSVDFFAINEDREGGNRFDVPFHERDIAECLTHKMTVAGVTYEKFYRDADLLSVYASGQFLNRDSYYGAGRSLDGYGNSKDDSYNVGAQYKALLGNATLVAGVENTGDYLVDKKLGYADVSDYAIVNVYDESGNVIGTKAELAHVDNATIANQSSVITGAFAQYELKLNKLKVSVGARFDHYEIKDKEHGKGDSSGDVFSPRLSFVYDVAKALQARASYSQGYRAPQIFDEDLHIESSALHTILHENAEGLKQETSHSYMVSLDYNKQLGKTFVGFLLEGFHTKLEDAFAIDYGEEPNENNEVTNTRINSTGANVQGVNMELKLMPHKNITFSSGLTLQTSQYEDVQDWGTKNFLRTPDMYGFFMFDWDFSKGFCWSATGNYTGPMDVLYEGEEAKKGIDVNGIVGSGSFLDFGTKLSYKYKLNGASIEFSAGIKNLFNAYQDDFDRGEFRDPAYVYGPVNPRTIHFGIKFGNLL